MQFFIIIDRKSNSLEKWVHNEFSRIIPFNSRNEIYHVRF